MFRRLKEGKLGKHILAVALSVVLAMPMVATPGMTANAASKIGNPRKDASGVWTWDRVYFGRYAQSDVNGVTKEAIKWRVLSVNGDDVFLMADSCLDAVSYEQQTQDTDWEKSKIRSWLNAYGENSNQWKQNYNTGSGFYDKAFVKSEKDLIMTTTLTNLVGNTTNDKIFLLSKAEAETEAYGLNDKASRVLKATAYVGNGGSGSLAKDTVKAGAASWWWLRDIDKGATTSQSAFYVTLDGTIAYYNVGHAKVGVVPAMHVKLTDANKSLWSYAGTVNSKGEETAGDKPPVVDLTETKDDNDTVVVEPKKDGTADIVAPAKNATGDVVIPETVVTNGVQYKVTSIAANAFKNNTKITSVTIPGNITSIGKNAFYGCANLKNVTMGDNVTTIGANAFYNCKKLTKITIPAKVNKIGKKAFYGCKSLKSINVQTTLLKSRNVGSKAFAGTHTKATVKVPKKKLKAYKKLLVSKGISKSAKIKK